MFTLLQEGGYLDLQGFHLGRQNFVPGFWGFQLFLHLLMVFHEGLIVYWDPLYRRGRRAVSQHINKFLFLFIHNYCTAHAPQMPPSSPSRWSECSWGSCLGEGFSEVPPHPETLLLHSGHLAVFADLTGSTAAQGPVPVAQFLFLLMLN